MRGGRDGVTAIARLQDRCSVIDGRGACRHPDGVVRFVRSSIEVFSADIDNHLRGVPCAGARSRERYLTVPALENEEELVWE